MRSWLVELSRDLEAADAAGVVPTLALEALWVQSSGRIMLLDFPAPGVAGDGDVASESAPQFLIRVAVAANPRGEAPHSVAVALNALAEPWVKARWAAAILHKLSLQPVTLNRWRRALPVLLCALPAIIGVTSSVLDEASVRARYAGPDATLVVLLDQMSPRETLKAPPETASRLHAYVAESFRAALAADPDFWTSARGRRFARDRKAIENIMRWYIPKSPDEVVWARVAADDWLLDQRQRDLYRWTAPGDFHERFTEREMAAMQPLLVVALFSVLFALLGNPLVFRLTGHALLDAEAADAGIGRRFVRAVVTWSPLLLIRLLPRVAALGWLPITLLAAGAIYALVSPERAIQDRIAGTYVVPAYGLE